MRLAFPLEAGSYSRCARRIAPSPRSSRARVTCLIGVFSVWCWLHDGERGEFSCGCCNSVGPSMCEDNGVCRCLPGVLNPVPGTGRTTPWLGLE